MTLARGDVHLVSFPFPDRQRAGQFQARDKFVVLLRGDSATDVPLVVASSLRSTSPPRAFEVIVRQGSGRFSVDTVIDCRWPYTLPKIWFTKQTFRFSLAPNEMREISLALVVGLEISL